MCMLSGFLRGFLPICLSSPAARRRLHPERQRQSGSDRGIPLRNFKVTLRDPSTTLGMTGEEAVFFRCRVRSGRFVSRARSTSCV